MTHVSLIHPIDSHWPVPELNLYKKQETLMCLLKGLYIFLFLEEEFKQHHLNKLFSPYIIKNCADSLTVSV